MRHIDTLVIHHSACRDGNVAIFTREHRERGWTTIGYHAVCGNGHGQGDGVIAQGRPDAMVGSGVFGANTGKLHICLVGNFHRADPGYTGRPTAAQFDALGGWLLNRGLHYDIPPYRIVGHKEVTIPGHPTACPGDQFPLRLVREWYAFALACHRNGVGLPKLSHWLDQHSYPTYPEHETTPTLVVNGQQYTGPIKVEGGTILVSASHFAATLGQAKIDWNPEKREANVTLTPK